MYSLLSRFRFRTFLAFVLALAFVPTALAARPYVDTGDGLTPEDANPYEKAQLIPGSPFEEKGVYGKLRGDVPVDLYKFTADRDGDVLLSLMVFKKEYERGSDPVLVLVDPNENPAARDLGFPLPDENYSTVLLTPLEEPRSYNEPALFEEYLLVTEQTVSVKEGQTYYLIVLDQYNAVERYAVKFGTEKAWSAGDIFTSFGSWFALKTDSYGGGNPFTFGPRNLGYLLFIFGLATLLGSWLVQTVFFVGSLKSKAMGHLLVKFQPFERIMIWVGLWFTALGGYLTFAGSSWSGIPFVLGALFLPLAAFQLVETFVLAPKVMKLEVAKREAVVPQELRTKLWITYGGTAAFLIAFLIFMSMRPLA